MKKIQILTLFVVMALVVNAQTSPADSVVTGKVVIIKDSRLDDLAKKEAAFNEANVVAPRTAKGFRLMILSTSDRPLAMKVRAQLLQRYPDQKVYMSFQPPFIKMKFGNFLSKQDADNVKKEIMKAKLVTGNVYTTAETIEIKPEKSKEKENTEN